MWAASASSTPTGGYPVEKPESARASDTLTRSGSLMQSTYVCRDHEITAFGPGNQFFLRYGGGKAISGRITTGGIEFENIFGGVLDLPNGVIPVYPYTGSNQTFLFSSIPGYTANSPSDLWTIGVSGFDVYVKYNGVECFRFKEYTMLQAGVAAVYGTAANTATVSYVPATLTSSNRALNMIGITDCGAKPSSVQATGSMSAGSNQLTVASTTGFAIGDQIIVEIGGEAGLGTRGTEGVGGAWPALSYANSTALLADTSQAAHTHAWDRSTGSVYVWNGDTTAGWSNAITPYETYYTNKALPKALIAKITAISGNVFTLDKTAVVATSGARIFVDCLPSFAPLTGLSYGQWAPDFFQIHVPQGSFALSGPVSVNALYAYTQSGGQAGHKGLQITGAGKTLTTLFPPRGIEEVKLVLTFAADTLIADLKVMGNHAVGSSGEIDGYLLTGMTTGSAQGPWPFATEHNSGFRGTTRDCSFESVFRSVGFSRQGDAWAFRCDVTMHQAANAYTQWQMGQVDSVGGGMQDCTGTSPKLMKIFEFFNCYPSDLNGLGPIYRRCGGQNTICSTNSSQGWLIEDYHATITVDCANDVFVNAGSLGEPVMTISANAYHSRVTGTIRNPRIVVTGYPDTSNNNSFVTLLQLLPDCLGVIVEGQYAGTSPAFPSTLGGYFETATYNGVSRNLAILDGGEGTIMRGLRCVGTVGASDGVIANQGNGFYTSYGTPSVTNCIADTFSLIPATTKSGNRTNAGTNVP